MSSSKRSWSQPSLEAAIVLSYKNDREAEAVAKAVLPDNVKLPQGLLIKTRREGSKVLTSIRCKTKFETFMATIDDLLSCVSIAEKAFSVAKELEKRSREKAP